jgi:hypothetical protein
MTVRVFVACTPAERLPMRVLEFSLRETSSLPVEVAAIHDFERATAIPLPQDLRNQPRTPFSFQRFLIPELCGYRGRAIYMDADMQVFHDIASLWKAPMGEHDLLAVREGNGGRKGQFSVMLLDCERLAWRVEEIVAGLDAGRYSYEQLMGEMCVARSVGRTLAPEWNSLEAYHAGRTCLLHYTNMVTQPWVSLDNPVGELWIGCLRRALAQGFVTEAQLRDAVAAGHVRPSLLPQAIGAETVPARLRALDRGFVAPYKSLRSGSATPWTSWRARGADYARRVLHRLRTL